MPTRPRGATDAEGVSAMSVARLRIQHGGTTEANAMSELLVEVYADAYADRVASGNPFSSRNAFAERLTRHILRTGFRLTTGWIDGELVGYSYGTRPDARTWLGAAIATAHPEIADVPSLFVVNELMVRRSWQNTGIGRLLHNAMIADIPDIHRVGLYMRPDNLPAQTLYARLGYNRLGRHRPRDEAPEFDVMILDLRSTSTV